MAADGLQFTAAEWIGGIVLIAVMTVLVRLTYPKALVEAARAHLDAGGGHDHGSMEGEGASVLQRLRDPGTRVAIAQNAVMDFSMLWKDLLGGFLIAGVLGACVRATRGKCCSSMLRPRRCSWSATRSLGRSSPSCRCVLDRNVPLAAILWASGISFGGVLAFLYADLIVLPLLDIYRTYYGWRMALYIFAVFFVTMVASAIIMDLLFGALHLVPKPNPNIVHDLTMFSFNYTFWLNIAFGALALWLCVSTPRIRWITGTAPAGTIIMQWRRTPTTESPYATLSPGFRTTFSQPSAFATNILYASGADSSGSVCVITPLGSMSPLRIRSSSG